MSMHTSAALFRDADPVGLLDAVAADLTAQDVTYARENGALECDTGIGQLRLCPETGALRIEVSCGSASNLHMLCEGVSARLDRLRGTAVALDWSGTERRTGGLPPNVRIARILSKERIGTRFLRLRLAAEDLGDFALSGLHIRLLIPSAERPPVWPHLNDKGRTVWPSAKDGMAMPAYTIRDIDAGAGWLDVDIFVHGRGPTCRWADEVRPGAEVGISGPGGGWMPPGRRWLMAGDETALPAIARILEAAPADAEGDVLIEVDTNDDRLDLSVPPGIRLRWLHRADGDDIVDTMMKTALPQGPERHIWFAAEKTRAAKVRTWLRSAEDVGPKESYVAGYWTETET
ncbi:NADPH-dependent ferric siderophore reductase, contains FAD-binding and SIP domains [Roseivivax marinus]|uniref:siderophore-interacting protein n=1 Tax=Roseivivax marinus TaxID=1379903 RepID=UPI0008B9375B|nr:siderophore-interacting protein [Roseivivax marinus]SEL95614.1 NADPH-dependent ferric siderophore reductase, contains FAD-binding and SIP domains [Roseivivax marinus]